jgi:hypothetical protein
MVYGGEIELDGVPSEGQKPTLRNLRANCLNGMGPCIGSARVYEITLVHHNWEHTGSTVSVIMLATADHVNFFVIMNTTQAKAH